MAQKEPLIKALKETPTFLRGRRRTALWRRLFEEPSCLARENGNDSKEQEASLHIESVAPVPKRF